MAFIHEESRITYTLAPGAKNCKLNNIRSFIYNAHKINTAFFLHVYNAQDINLK